MKRFFLLLASVLFTQVIFAQNEVPQYLQTKTLPPVRLILPDSSGWEIKAKRDKKKPMMIIFFSPECDHCQHETEEFVKNIDKLKHIQIVMATTYPLKDMRGFIKNYNLGIHPNIVVGRDYAYILPVYFNIKNLPYHAFYNKAGKLIGGFEGNMTIEKILQVLPK
ncbi:MAG: redoxin domain-containing protein [Sphingobacteriales bacterium]|jgi:thioredoxin-related protein|nr:redoxin domain-containing protein [Sphingobacteriales bacterium]